MPNIIWSREIKKMLPIIYTWPLQCSINDVKVGPVFCGYGLGY